MPSAQLSPLQVLTQPSGLPQTLQGRGATTNRSLRRRMAPARGAMPLPMFPTVSEGPYQDHQRGDLQWDRPGDHQQDARRPGVASRQRRQAV